MLASIVELVLSFAFIVNRTEVYGLRNFLGKSLEKIRSIKLPSVIC